jgi:hypothetical protein
MTRGGRTTWFLAGIPVEEVRPMIEHLVVEYGSVSAAARALADRHDLSADSCARQLRRIRHGHQDYVCLDTYDRLWVM